VVVEALVYPATPQRVGLEQAFNGGADHRIETSDISTSARMVGVP
jgi:hypothetical protein